MKVQTIGMKLNKSRRQNVTQFILGLPDSTYRWVEDREPESIEEALRQAIDYELLFKPHKSHYASAETQPPPRRYDPAPSFRRRDEPMEFTQRGYSRDRFGQNATTSRGRGYNQGHFRGASNSMSYGRSTPHAYASPRDQYSQYPRRGGFNQGSGQNQQSRYNERTAHVNQESMERAVNLSWDGYVHRSECEGERYATDIPVQWFDENQDQGNDESPIVTKN